MIKKCLKCGQEKDVCEFNKDKNREDGLCPYCKNCKSEDTKRRKELRKKSLENQPPPISEKLCPKCNIVKPTSEFGRDYSKTTTIATYCKECVQTFPSQMADHRNIKRRELRQKNKERDKEKNKLEKKLYYQRHKKERIKKAEEYYLKNKEKILEKQRSRYEENKENHSKKAKEYRAKNSETIKQKKREYYQQPEVRRHATQKNRQWKKNNPEKRREMDRRYLNKDPIRKIIRNMRTRIYTILNRTGSEKANHTIKMLGCSRKFLKEHLESQFYSYINEYGKTINMSWDNFGSGSGTWQVDHVVALTLFNLNNKEEQLIANHWTNLQPLWFHDHIVKSKLDLELKKDLNLK